MIHIAVVEDEDNYAETFEKYIERYQKEHSEEIELTRFSDGMEILDEYNGSFDIIFMDIKMKFLNGMTTAQKIRKVDKEVAIIFITNLTQYAIKGYAVDALDYVLKPVSYFSLSQKLERAISRLKDKDNKYITLTAENMMHKVNLKDIYYVESQGHNQTFHTTQGDFSIRSRMNDIESKLSMHNFFRSNKGYIVNMNYVTGVENSFCIVNDNRLIISRNRKKEFMDRLSQFISDTVI